MGIAPFKIDEINHLRDDITKIFDNFFDKKDSTIAECDFIPPVNISERNNLVFIEVEVPGVEKGEIEVIASKSNIIIKGIKKSRTSGSDDLFHRIERNFGKFYRNITIPFFVEEDKVSAEMKNGVLTIILKREVEKAVKNVDIIFEE